MYLVLGFGELASKGCGGLIDVHAPLSDLSSKFVEVSVSRHGCLLDEGQGISEPCNLRCVVSCNLISCLSSGDDGYPDFLLKSLVGIRSVYELSLQPVAGRGLALAVGFIDVPHSFIEDSVVPLDPANSVVVTIKVVATGKVQLSEIMLCLLVLLCELAEPARAVDYINRPVWYSSVFNSCVNVEGM